MAVTAPTVIATWASTTNVTTSSGAINSASAIGDLLFITVHAGSDSAAISISDSKGNTWQASDHATNASAPPTTTRVFWSKLTNALTTSDTITVNRALTGGLAWIASKVSGASGVVNASAALADVGQTVTGPTLTATTGSLYVMAVTCRDVVQFTANNGYTTSTIVRSTGTGNPRGGGYIYRQSTTATASTPELKMDIALGWTGIAIEIIPETNTPEPSTEPQLVEWDGTTMRPLQLIEWDGTTMTPLHLWGAPRTAGTIALIGDSNTYRDGPPPFGSREATTRQRLEAAGWLPENIYWYGAGGKAMLPADQYAKTTIQNLDDAQAQLGHIDQAVIALGTNDTPLSDASFVAAMNAILDKCATLGINQVIWVNLAYKASNNANSTRFNPLIASTIASRGFAQTADWHTYIHTTNYSAADWITEDGTHYTASGYAKRDAFIIAQLGATLPEPVEDLPFMGGYLGTPGETPDERYFAAFGAYPAVASTYYQGAGTGGGANINLTYEKARRSRGTIPLITVTSVGGTYTMAQIASGAADTWIDYWRDNIAQIGGEVWFTFDHEFEVKLNQNKWATPPTIAEYAAAYNRFTTRVKAGAPNAKTVYWYGYSDTTKIAQIGAQIDSPDLISLDPYVFSHHAGTTTFTQMVEPKLNWLRSQSWYRGQPIFLSEYAIDSIHGDTQMGLFYTDLRPKMQALGLAGAMLFCRDRVDDIMANISNDNWPQAKAAYRASMLDT